MTKTDLRIIKTKKNIYESFLSLMGEKTFEEIKVSEICDRAMINRSTFYSHFDDKYTLFDSLINDMRSSLIERLDNNVNILNVKQYYIELMRILLDEIESNKDLYCASLINNKNSIAMDMIYTTIKEDFSKKIIKNLKGNIEIPAEFLAYFYIGAIYTSCTEWIKDDFKYSKDDIINYIDRLIPEDLIK